MDLVKEIKLWTGALLMFLIFSAIMYFVIGSILPG
jgi:hypothetical protein